MSTIILDVSANTHKNDRHYLKKMLDELKKVDTGKHCITIKHQLFQKSGENIPLDRETFTKAYNYAKELGYKTTSSVFDKESLDFLLQFDIPFIKLANNRELDWLVGEIPRRIPVYQSIDNDYKFYENSGDYESQNIYKLFCISKYPTSIEDYEKQFREFALEYAVSDHTTNFKLWHKYKPQIIEWHYVLEHDPSNLDGGLFARTPTILAEIL